MMTDECDTYCSIYRTCPPQQARAGWHYALTEIVLVKDARSKLSFRALYLILNIVGKRLRLTCRLDACCTKAWG